MERVDKDMLDIGVLVTILIDLLITHFIEDIQLKNQLSGVQKQKRMDCIKHYLTNKNPPDYFGLTEFNVADIEALTTTVDDVNTEAASQTSGTASAAASAAASVAAQAVPVYRVLKAENNLGTKEDLCNVLIYKGSKTLTEATSAVKRSEQLFDEKKTDKARGNTLEQMLITEIQMQDQDGNDKEVWLCVVHQEGKSPKTDNLLDYQWLDKNAPESRWILLSDTNARLAKSETVASEEVKAWEAYTTKLDADIEIVYIQGSIIDKVSEYLYEVADAFKALKDLNTEEQITDIFREDLKPQVQEIIKNSNDSEKNKYLRVDAQNYIVKVFFKDFFENLEIENEITPEFREDLKTQLQTIIQNSKEKSDDSERIQYLRDEANKYSLLSRHYHIRSESMRKQRDEMIKKPIDLITQSMSEFHKYLVFPTEKNEIPTQCTLRGSAQSQLNKAGDFMSNCIDFVLASKAAKDLANYSEQTSNGNVRFWTDRQKKAVMYRQKKAELDFLKRQESPAAEAITALEGEVAQLQQFMGGKKTHKKHRKKTRKKKKQTKKRKTRRSKKPTRRRKL